MSKFGSKEDILKLIETRFDQMRTSRLSMEDLETLVEHARELYERTLILRYKAYEEKVFGEVQEVLQQDTQEPAVEVLEEVKEAVLSPENEINADQGEAIHEIQHAPEAIELEAAPETEESENEPVFDFSLFDEAEEQQLPIFETETSDPVEDEIETAVSAPEISNESAYEAPQPAEEVQKEAPKSADGLFASVWQDDNSLASRLSASKLDTLLGSFGFNERFQVVQELFKGSTDDFNQAIEVLDNLSDKTEAENQLLYYVRLNNWDLESEIAVEFIRKIERRYL